MNEFDAKTFAGRLKALREERGMDQDALAAASGVNKTTIARYETCRSAPRVDVAIQLARVLDCSLDVLTGVVPLAVA